MNTLPSFTLFTCNVVIGAIYGYLIERYINLTGEYLGWILLGMGILGAASLPKTFVQKAFIGMLIGSLCGILLLVFTYYQGGIERATPILIKYAMIIWFGLGVELGFVGAVLSHILVKILQSIQPLQASAINGTD